MLITVTFSSRLTKVGNKLRTFEELFKLSPEMVLDAFKQNNNLTLCNECREFLSKQTRYKAICTYIVKLSNYRLEKAELQTSERCLTFSSDLDFGNYHRKNQHGVFCGYFHGY